MPVNPNEAPDGFVAAHLDGMNCETCAMADDPLRCFSSKCMTWERQDKSNVMFIPVRIMATASWPHDDMGTPV